VRAALAPPDGETVFDCDAPAPGLHVYVHSLRDRPSGKAVLAINLDREKERMLALPVPAERYTLTAKELQARSVMLNGSLLQVSSDGTLPALSAEPASAGATRLPPTSITFLAIHGE
jgi:hypothetical protein